MTNPVAKSKIEAFVKANNPNSFVALQSLFPKSTLLVRINYAIQNYMIHIGTRKKVEIFGFKSFGFKNTIVDFEPGLVSISGPNGSGKSNILDAITFALGENRPKVMRAPNLRALMHDVEGSTRRGPKMARTSVHFDNTDRKIPVDSDIVTITREMNDKVTISTILTKKRYTFKSP